MAPPKRLRRVPGMKPNLFGGHVPVRVEPLICFCGKQSCEHITDDQKRDFYSGAYDTCRMLLTSPRMLKAQREIIEEVALNIREQLEALGVKFNTKGQQS